ncbi:MBL fold metallo-hydrolase [Aquimarina litoralis]|uniref:MBL fold metallo-hydrolase n=1 Tax=Aquimarina litoralis TaxID=584605 RepID=UPI001C571493|nr:MBL fold metallo-hydrolase [Aquimarina litoralis]MBW1298587.1 MBL fold metallo-hydrolase [Aquimarina litoralis]
MNLNRIGTLSLPFLMLFMYYSNAQQNASGSIKTLYEIEDHVYLFQGGGTWALNSIILEGKDTLTLIDTHFSDENNLALIQQLKDTFPNKKVGTIVISHPHADHFMGVKLFKDAFGEIEVISIEGERNHMKQTAKILYNAYQEVSPNQLVKLHEIVYPNKQMGKDFTIHFSDRVAQFELVDQNESWKSLIMYLPDTHLIYLGDLYWGGLTLDIEGFGASLILWEKELRNIMDRKTGKIIPGHGVGLPSRDTILTFLDDILSFINTSKAFIEQGMQREDYITSDFHKEIIFFGGREMNLSQAYDEIKTAIENEKN